MTDTTYYYRVIANNLVGDTFDYTITNPNAKGFQTVMVNSTASNTASTDQLYNIIRGPNDEILYSTYNFDTAQWSDLMALPSGATIDTPTATTIGGQLYIAVRGTDGSSSMVFQRQHSRQLILRLGQTSPAVNTFSANTNNKRTNTHTRSTRLQQPNLL